jgi:hypothetical protein
MTLSCSYQPFPAHNGKEAHKPAFLSPLFFALGRHQGAQNEKAIIAIHSHSSSHFPAGVYFCEISGKYIRKPLSLCCCIDHLFLLLNEFYFINLR